MACLPGQEDAATALDRLDGYRRALAETGAGEAIYAHSAFTRAGGAAAAAAIFDSGQRPDAFLADNALLALGLFEELKRRGLRVGHDVGVITIDDSPWAPFIEPAMSVVAQPAAEIGARAAQLLMDRIAGTAPAEPRAVLLSTTMIVRDSSRRLDD